MAKGDHDSVMNAINTQRTQQQGQQNSLSDTFNNQYKNAYSSDQGLKSTITQGYQNYLNPDNLNALFSNAGFANLSGGGGGGVSGGIDPSLISSMGAVPYTGYQQLSGGLATVNPDFQGQFDASMGNVDQANKSYQDFINTGGFSQSDMDTMRAQGNAPNLAINQNAQNNLQTAQNAAHGNLGNVAVAQAHMARDAGAQSSLNSVNTESNLAQMKQQGKEFGTTGLAQTSLAQAQARTAVQQLDAQLREAGLAGMTDIEKTRLQGELTNAQINEQASAANGSLSLGRAQLQNQEAMAKLNMPMQALQGLNTLYGTTPADTNMSGQDLLNLQQISQTGNLGLINSQINAGNIPSDFQQGMGNVSSVLGGLGNLASAASGLGSGGGGGGSNSSSQPGNSQVGNNSGAPIGGNPGTGNFDGNGNPIVTNPGYGTTPIDAFPTYNGQYPAISDGTIGGGKGGAGYDDAGGYYDDTGNYVSPYGVGGINQIQPIQGQLSQQQQNPYSSVNYGTGPYSNIYSMIPQYR